MNGFDKMEERGSTIALYTEKRIICYSELVCACEAIADRVSGRCLLFCVCTSTPAAIAGYFGFLKKRIVPVMINTSINPALFDSLYNCYRPQYVWCPTGYRTGRCVYEYEDYTLLKTEYDDVPEMNDQLAVLLTTSGSTGSPKLVRQTYRNIEANTESIVEYLHIQQEDRAITTLPMSYTFGLSIIQSHIFAGAALILNEHTFMEKEFWTLCREKKATTFGGVPYSYEMLKRLRFLRMDLPALRYVTQAGGKLGRELHYEFAEGMRAAGKEFIVMYGATEATARMSYVPADVAVEKAGSIGIAIPGGHFELADTDGSVIKETDSVGELIYYGDNVTPGYAHTREDLAKSDERHGRLETGDMAIMDADGFYYIVGRKKRFLKLYGNRINLVEVEEMLAKRGFETVCVGEDDHMRIYTTNDNTQAIHDCISTLTGINRAAFTVIKIKELPRNESGKIQYAELR